MAAVAYHATKVIGIGETSERIFALVFFLMGIFGAFFQVALKILVVILLIAGFAFAFPKDIASVKNWIRDSFAEGHMRFYTEEAAKSPVPAGATNPPAQSN